MTDYYFGARRLGEPPTRTCGRCGKEYKPTGRQQKWCSKECRMKAFHERKGRE